MTEAPLNELYFNWLYAQVANPRLRNPARTHWKVLLQLYTTEFVWSVPNDDNRVREGQELRYEFLEANPNANPDRSWLEEGASFLEMLIALSRRLSFNDERASSAQWFWEMMNNADLRIFDSEYDANRLQRHVSRVLTRLNNRTYDFDGKGGLFPLANTDVDQRREELWLQMNYYLLERS